jgi:hypothetical protein
MMADLPSAQERTSRERMLTPDELAQWAALSEQSRLSLPTPARVPVITAASFAVGLGLGLVQGSRTAGLRFRAEHAHKLPSTQVGWYMYHKSKNYNMAFGGIKEGLRMGARTGFWTASFLVAEAWWDYYRGTADVANTVAASVAVSGLFSLWSTRVPFDTSGRTPSLTSAARTDGFSLPTAARTTKTAILVGFAYGGLQDLLGLLRGRKISYIELAKRRFGVKEMGTTTAVKTKGR